MERRTLLTRTALLGTGALATACTASSGGADRPKPTASQGRAGRDGPVALVYRGPAGCDGCAQAVAALLASAASPFTVRYCGPNERVPLTGDALRSAAVYAQPGGGDDVDRAWAQVKDAAPAVREFVRGGGRYLGFCLGGYLAGSDPGFGLLPGDSDGYIDSPGATVRTPDDTLVGVRWRGRRRHMYFQDGPLFRLEKKAKATVLATYDSGPVAALVAPFGDGRVGVVGPHPEADRSWYEDEELTNPDGVRTDLGHDLIAATMRK